MNGETILGVFIPFIGTSLGAAMVFILKKNISDTLQKILTGFAAGFLSGNAGIRSYDGSGCCTWVMHTARIMQFF